MGRKGKKLNKATLEAQLKVAKEDQERQENQEHLRKLEDDTLAQHRERLSWELDSRLRVEEAERLEEENVIVTRLKGERQQNLEYEQQKLADQVNWQKFISCTSRPNVAFENEITTYMTMVREEKVQKVEDAREKCRESEEIVGDLMELYCKAREEGDRKQQDWCMHYIHQIRDLEIELVDEATAYLLQYIEKQEANSHSQIYMSWGQQNDTIKIGFWGHLQSKGFRAKQIDFPKVQIGLDLPKSIAMQSMGHLIGVRALYTTYDSVGNKGGSQMSVGGMIRVDLLSIPPFSKKVKGWTIRQIPPPGQELMRLPYPNTEHTATAAAAVAAQPCKVEYKVSSHVIVRKAPTISFWDTATESWSTEGITEISWEPEVRKVSFFSARLASFSITQERHLDLPYAWWVMRPLSSRVCELTVQAARYELHFVISEDGLRLKGPELPELHDIMYEGTGPDRLARVRSPATLLCELRDCGLMLMPEDCDAEFLDGYTPKNPSTEARAYSDLSEMAGYWDIASSKHNKELPPDRFGPGSDRALVRIRENLLFEEYDSLDPDCDTDYQAVMFFPDKACLVQSLEQTSPCNEKPLTGHLTHASLHLCFDRHPDPRPDQAEVLDRMRVTCSNARFVESVRQTIALMRLLSFA
eukprot:TRINITY_DN91603_c0_g1_i1.p1 TRINITY_DN91603_c0_g1~~TRINITY_DN91603_c0_g1_i1.p1  ORF type:complete len:641 (-),score=151.68 TRINITY_DN91603_c0_g1_i1:304-2226(-)